MRQILFLSFVSFGLLGGLCSKKQLTWDAERMMKDLRVFTEEPHPFGSSRQEWLANYIEQSLTPDVQVEKLAFEAQVPNPQPTSVMDLTVTRKGTNVLAYPKDPVKPHECMVLVGSHYDTKAVEGLAYVGANDSGSSSVVLMELARYVSRAKVSGCGLAFIWFDGEESSLPGWYDGEKSHPARIVDHTHGSRHFVQHHLRDGKLVHLPGQPRLVAFILLDMVGHPQLRFSREQHSHPTLMRWRDEILKEMGEASRIATEWKAIEDDHYPFLQAGIPAIDLIDFENVYEWHAKGDTFSLVSPQSLMISASLAMLLAQRAALQPKELQP